MGILRKMLITLVALFLLAAIVGFFLPSAAHVERSVTIDAPVAAVYAKVSDLRQFNDWSPWYGIDPDATYEVEGDSGAVGSRLTWTSDDRGVGNGSQTITGLTPNELVTLALDFGAEGDATTYYRLTPVGDGTQMVWGFDVEFGGNPFSHYFTLVMDRMVGTSYEDGLAKLKELIENETN